MTRSNDDRGPIVMLWVAFALIVVSIVLGFCEHWTVAAPAAALLRFAVWILRGVYGAVPVFAAGSLIVSAGIRRAGELSPVMAVALRWAVGSAVVTLVGLIMLAGGWYSPAIWQLLALLGWLGIAGWLLATRWKPLLDVWKAFRSWRPERLPLLSWESLLAVMGTMVMVAAFLPPDTRDELAYHLVLPKLWTFQGNWWVPVTNFHLLFPANTEILWGWSMATGGLLAARFFTVLFAALTVALLWEWFGAQPGERWGRNVALVLLLAAPVALTSASICYVEWPLMFFLLLGWRLSRLDGVLGARAAIWTTAGVWGMSLGMKYTAFLFAGLLALEWLVSLWRKNRRWAVTALLALVASACVFSGPWLVRNAIATGDPVVPLGSAIGLGRMPHQDAAGLADYVHLTGLWRLAPSVYHATADPLADHRLHPAWPLILLAVLAVGWRWRRELPWITVAASSVLLLPFSPSPRIELPLLLLATLFVPALLTPAARSRSVRALATAITLLVALISMPLSAYFLFADGGPAIPRYLIGLIGPRAYLSERGVETPAMRWVEEKTPRDARIWVWCDDRVLYFDRWVRPDGPFQPPVFLSDLRRDGAAALARAAGDVDFIAVRRDHCPAGWTVARVEQRSWKIGPADRWALTVWMRKHLRPVFRGPRYTIYRPVGR